jgi:transcriptional antiterminator RfaH
MRHWYVVHTKVRQESVAEEHLARQHIEVYLPRLSVARRRRAKWVDAVEPLFPRYLFVRTDNTAQGVHPIRSTRGVRDLVRFGDRLACLRDELVQEIRAQESPATRVRHLGGGSFEPGDRVRAVRGPFNELEGVFLTARGEDRVGILMHLLHRDVPVVLSRHDVIRVDA